MGRSDLALLAVLALLPFVAQSAVYRCVKDGKTTYTDQPCSPGAEPADLPAINATTTGNAHTRGLAAQYDREQAKDDARQNQARAAAAERYEQQHAQDQAIRKGLIEGRVVKGMTRAQVERVLNLPLRVDDEGGPRERWIYQNGRERRTIAFKDGVVVSDSTHSGRR